MNPQPRLSTSQVFLAFLKLGLTSFGGPVAHLGYYREEFVVRRRLLAEESYADLVALCQFLPGPASTQTAIGIGLSQAGLRGGLAAWCGFTAPSALAMMLFAYGVTRLEATQSSWLHGLKVVAVAVVAQAIWGMAQRLCPDRPRGSLAILAASLTLAWPGFPGQLTAIAAGALAGLALLGGEQVNSHQPQLFALDRRFSLASLALFFLLLLVLPLLARGGHALALFDSFYRTGSLVFGGGHVVLPLLQAEVVGPGWVDKDLFLAGYGAAQAMPGPLFTLAAYLGAAGLQPPNGWLGGLLCLVAIFLPSFLLLVGILPFWDGLRRNRRVRAALTGVNAAVVGLLLAAFYNPIWTSSILSGTDFVLALAAFGLLALWQAPAWLVVVLTGLAAALL